MYIYTRGGGGLYISIYVSVCGHRQLGEEWPRATDENKSMKVHLKASTWQVNFRTIENDFVK